MSFASKHWKTILSCVAAILVAGSIAAWAAQTNYLGTVFIADSTTPANQLKVNSDGSINAVTSGGGSGTVNTGTTPNGAYYATSTTAVSDGGSATVTFGGVNLTSSTIPANGVYLGTTNTLSFSNAGANAMSISTGSMALARTVTAGTQAEGFSLILAAASSTVPTLVPRRSSSTTGIGAQASGNISEIIAGTEVTRWTSTGPQFIVLPTDAATTDNTLCVNTTTHIVSFGSGTLGICLGTSSARFKREMRPISAVALPLIKALVPTSFRYKAHYGDGGRRVNYWMIAEEVEKVLPQCVPTDSQGRPNSVDPTCVQAFLIKAFQEKAASDDMRINALQMQVQQLALKRR